MNPNTHIVFFSEPFGYIGYNELKNCDKILTQADVIELKRCGVIVKQHLSFKDIYISAQHFTKKQLARYKKVGYDLDS